MNSKHTYIIAEAGVNHNGDVAIAKQMIHAAVSAGADAIKFQTFDASALVTLNAPKAQYQTRYTSSTESQYQMLKKLELTKEEFCYLKTYCNEEKIEFISTPFDLGSIELLEDINVNKYKIPSGEVTNYPYLVRIARTNKPILMSTGMCTVQEIEDAINVLKSHGAGQLTLLHCTTEYPTPYCDVNLKAMLRLKEIFNVDIGYSDHTQGIEVAIAAAAIGASVIEKHFTLDRTMKGPDHQASLVPSELNMMVSAIRNTDKAMGDGIKKPEASEIKNIMIARKSIVAKTAIRKGEIFSVANITTKRPGIGISPMRWNEVIGKRATRNFKIDEFIEI